MQIKFGKCHSVPNILYFYFLYKNVKIQMYKTLILPVVWYGHETWYLAMKEEHRLRMFEYRVLRGIFGSLRKEVTGG
jgi:hypothetical protein